MSHDAREEPGRIVARWWIALHPDQRNEGGDRAALARLRRAPDPRSALVEPMTLRLVTGLRDGSRIGHRVHWALQGRDGQRGGTGELLLAIGCIAATLAAVGPSAEPPTARFAGRLGETPDGGRPGPEDRRLLSVQRFARLLAADDWDARLRLLRRAVAQLHGRAFDVPRFAADLLHWGERTRTRWIFDYHQEPRTVAQDPPSASAEETAQ